jgi:hypothetical protein
VSGVDGGEVVQLLGQVLDGKNGATLAGRNTGTATEALLGVDEKLFHICESRLVDLGVNRFSETDGNAKHVFDAFIGDNAEAGHDVALLITK